MLRHENGRALHKEEALANLIERSTVAPRVETVALYDAAGRVLAHDHLSKQTIPGLPHTRMDGIATRFAYFADGLPDTRSWTEGVEYVYCNCGIGIKGDYDTVIRIEDVEVEDGRIVVTVPPKEAGAWMEPAGSTMHAGDTIAGRGDVVSPFLLSRLATGGYAEVDVYERPVVAFIPTGRELVNPGEPVPPDMNVDSNSAMVYAKVRNWGGEPRMYPIQRDNLQEIIDTLQDAIAHADIVVINAGSSQGQHDHTHEALEDVTEVLSSIIKSGPGAHTTCAVAVCGKPVVGIPGPPVGAEAVVDWFVKPLIDTYYGIYQPAPLVRAVWRGEARPASERDGWKMIGRGNLVRTEDGSYAVNPVGFGDAAGMDRANCFVYLGPDACVPGEPVTCELRHPYRFVGQEG